MKLNHMHLITHYMSKAGQMIALKMPTWGRRNTKPYQSTHRAPRWVQDAKIAAAGEKRMRRRDETAGVGELNDIRRQLWR